VPLFSFLLLVEVARRVPASLEAPLFVLKVAVPLALLVVYALRGSYPELRGYRPGLAGLAGDVAVGVAGAFLWMAPYVLVEAWRPDASEAFDPELLGPGLAGLALSVRGIGYAGVTPFVEELFARSWLHRYIESLEKHVDFRDLAIGTPSRAGFLAVVVYWLVSHVSWEAPVAVAWAALTTLWLYRRRHLAAVVVVHAASNLTILLAAAIASGRLRDPAGRVLDLWFFV
jgi:CAAX prenyl protease-like protein